MESIPECTSHLFLFHKPSGKYSATKLSFCRTGETRKAILVVKQVVGPLIRSYNFSWFVKLKYLGDIFNIDVV